MLMDYSTWQAWALTVVPALIVLATVFSSVHIKSQYETAVVFRLGSFRALKTGVFLTMPFIEYVAATFDTRVSNTIVEIEKCLSADMLSLSVDAVLIWQITDPKQALLSVDDVDDAIELLGETALREIVGSSPMEALIANRDQADAELRARIGTRAAGWGATIIDVRIRDVQIPEALNNAMSQEAQAQRERQARVTLAQAEKDIAQTLVDAAAVYGTNPTALELRRMNIAYEGLKSDQSKIIVVPTSIANALASPAPVAARVNGVGVP